MVSLACDPDIAGGIVEYIQNVTAAVRELCTEARVRYEKFPSLIVSLQPFRRGKDDMALQAAGVNPSRRHALRWAEFLRTNIMFPEIETPNPPPGGCPHPAVRVFQHSAKLLARRSEFRRLRPVRTMPRENRYGRLPSCVYDIRIPRRGTQIKNVPCVFRN